MKKKIIAAMLTIAVMIPAAEIQPDKPYFQPEQREIVLTARSIPAETKQPESEIYTITAYCGCAVCCGKWASVPVIGAASVPLYEGYSCATPVLEFGTKVDIEGLGVYEVQDRPAKHIADRYNNKIIDIYFANHDSALQFGKQQRKVVVLDAGAQRETKSAY